MKSKEEIFSERVLKTEAVNIPEWGGEVTVTAIPAIERDRAEVGWRARRSSEDDVAGLKAWLVAHMVINGDGKRFFDPVGDFDNLCQQPSAIIERLCDVGCRLNGIGKSDQSELLKN